MERTKVARMLNSSPERLRPSNTSGRRNGSFMSIATPFLTLMAHCCYRQNLWLIGTRSHPPATQTSARSGKKLTGLEGVDISRGVHARWLKGAEHA